MDLRGGGSMGRGPLSPESGAGAHSALTLGFTPNPFRVTPKGKGVRAEWAPALWALALTPLG